MHVLNVLDTTKTSKWIKKINTRITQRNRHLERYYLCKRVICGGTDSIEILTVHTVLNLCLNSSNNNKGKHTENIINDRLI